MTRFPFQFLSLTVLLLASVVGGPLSASEPTPTSPLHNVACDGTYRQHLQGICTNQTDAVFWSFTSTLVKTDLDGMVLKQIPVRDHHGDLCYHNGRVYVAVNFGKFNDTNGNADSWVYVYNADDLVEAARHKTPELFYGAGGIASHDGRFFVVGGLPADIEQNFVYEYDADFQFVKKHVIESGQTHLGIQTATFADGHFWFGCYGNPQITLKTDVSFQMRGQYKFDCSLGIEALRDGRFLIAGGSCNKESGCSGRVVVGTADPEKGLVK